MRKKIKYIVLYLLLLGGMLSANAQQDPQYTQYMYNTININPAYVGSRGVMSIFGMYRTQWVGLEGAPKTTNLSIHTPIGNSRIGIGGTVSNDKLGVMDENNFTIDLSYNIDINRNYRLSFGIKAKGNLLNVDYKKLNIYNPNDIVFQKNIKNQFNPNFGAGVYLHSDQTYFGFSIPNFIESDRYNDNEIRTMKQKRTFYFIGGHVFDLNTSFKIKPAFLLKAVEGVPLQLDITANVLFKDKFVFGGAYRWDAAFSALVGVQLNEGIFVGYTYDGDTTQLKNYNSGSHEVFLRFELFNRYNRINSPRFF